MLALECTNHTYIILLRYLVEGFYTEATNIDLEAIMNGQDIEDMIC